MSYAPLLFLCFLGLACSADSKVAQRIPSAGAAPESSNNINMTGLPTVTSNVSGGTTLPPPIRASDPPPTTSMPIASTRMPISIDQCGADNPAMLNDEQRMKLLAGSGTPGALRWLYPYEGTVFPRGMLAPMLMWEGGPADAVYLHIKSQFFEYKGCLEPSADGQLAVPQDIWDRAGAQSFGKPDPFTIELSTLQGGAATGPLTRTIIIALANIKGSIYYNSYSSALGAGLAGSGLPGLGGTVLRIPQGKTAEPFLNVGCNGCHAVSANGARLISQFAPMGSGQSFGLDMNTAANPAGLAVGPRAAWGALYPDGSHYLATSVQVQLARTFMAQGPGAPVDATLYNATSGDVVPNTGIPGGALMPMFSPDGSLLVFNDNAIDAAHGLALMKYDVTAHAASEPRTLMTSAGNLRPGWPFILPDNRGVVFTQTDGRDFSGDGAGLLGAPGLGIIGPVSDLYVVDIETSTVTVLARAMGFETPDAVSGGQPYLPFGAEEVHHNYFPTLSAVAAGGYFWVFFDSVRHYGNFGLQRALWASAIEINPDGDYSRDPSQPAFYLPGQEFNTGNHRAFAALDPCKPDGDSCLSGVDCCGGRCFLPEPNEFEQPPGSCSPPTTECAATDERCVTDQDCCAPEPGQPANTCIAGFCAYVMLN